MISELMKHGLCRRIERRGEDGKFEGLEYVIYETPQPLSDIQGEPEPQTDFQAPEKSGSENPPLTNKESKQVKKQANKAEASPPVQPAAAGSDSLRSCCSSFQMTDEEGRPKPRSHARDPRCNNLSLDQKQVYDAFMALMPMKTEDHGLTSKLVCNWLLAAGISVQRAMQVIDLYKRDAERYQSKGETIDNLAGYLTAIINSGRIGESDKSSANRKWFNEVWSDGAPKWCYKVFQKHVDFPHIGIDVSFDMDEQLFKAQVNNAWIKLSGQDRKATAGCGA
jgi:hypothetical protein